MPIRLISRSEVARLLPMGQAIELMRKGFKSLAEGGVDMPARQRILTENGDMLVKPACLPGKGLCVKLAMTYHGNPAKGLPLVQGLVMVIDDLTGNSVFKWKRFRAHVVLKVEGCAKSP